MLVYKLFISKTITQKCIPILLFSATSSSVGQRQWSYNIFLGVEKLRPRLFCIFHSRCVSLMFLKELESFYN